MKVIKFQTYTVILRPLKAIYAQNTLIKQFKSNFTVALTYNFFTMEE